MTTSTRVRNFLLGVIAASLIAVSLIVGFFHLGLVAISSGSMSPMMHRGDYAITRMIDRDEIRRGDVLVLPHPFDSSTCFAHRVVGMHIFARGLEVETKGDANEERDSWRMRISEEGAPKVVVVIPSSRWGMASWVGLLLGLPLILVFGTWFLIALFEWIRKSPSPD